MVVYVDDIVITSEDYDVIAGLKQHLLYHFQVKDKKNYGILLELRWLIIRQELLFPKHKYVLDILEETGILDCKPIDTHMDSNIKFLRDRGWSFSDPGTYKRYCILIGGNLTSKKSKKQNAIVKYNVEVEYQAMTHATQELIWLNHLLQELNFCKIGIMSVIYDNQATLHIASKSIFYERTKHIEVVCHFICEKLVSGEIIT
ncbi:uncharacterized protein LOC131598263 [Vicia villosa]|uniref:uncharacterized protein LOC131598263 n=1 Tax=Vicia villosa TaxID=3911 RepID=UPI00273AB002|nr:uncharacterized protein LOC131598263 [Vicia villosa]